MRNLLKIALSEYGTKEVPYDGNNPEITKYAVRSGIKGISDDEVPWCSSFINWCAFMAKLERTNNPVARSWMKIGEEVKEPETGDLVILKRGNKSWQGHVGIFINYVDDSLIRVLGGNQNDEVNISVMRCKNVVGYRRLRKEPTLEKIDNIELKKI